jgi:ATP-dependent Zn protease
LLTDHRAAFDRVVELLLQKETIDGRAVEEAVAATRPRPARAGAG